MERRKFLRSAAQAALSVAVISTVGCGTDGAVTGVNSISDFSPGGGSMATPTAAVNITARESDPQGGFLEVFSDQRIVRRTFAGGLDWEASGFNWPVAVAMDPQGNVHVVDKGGSEIQVLSSSGTFVRSYGEDDLDSPSDIAIDSDGTVYVADTLNHTIRVYDASGNLLNSVGDLGQDPGQLNGPKSLALASAGIYVVDQGNNRVQVFSRSGGLVGVFGQGVLKMPRSIAVDGAGNSYVADVVCNCVFAFDSSGNVLQELTPMLPDGKPATPMFVAINGDGQLFVSAVPAFDESTPILLASN